MNLIRFYKFIIIGLVILNMIVLAFFLLTKPRHLHQPPPKIFQVEVIKLFDFDNAQASAFKELTEGHKQKMREIDEQQKKLLMPYFESLTNFFESADKDSLLSQFQQLEKEKIEVTYRHFEEIRELLNKDQLTEFEGFMRDVTDKLLSGKKENHQPPKDFR